MEARTPTFKILGLEKVIEKDYRLHMGNLNKAKIDLETFKQDRSYQIQKKGYYKELIKKKTSGDPKYNMDALVKAKTTINVDLRKIEDGIRNAEGRIEHFTEITDTLRQKLKDEYDIEI